MIEFTVPDMTCGQCAGRIRAAVSDVNNKANVNIDLARHLVRITSSQAEAVFREALADADYPPA